MNIESTGLIGLRVFTPTGFALGDVSNIVVNIEKASVDGLFITDTNRVLVEGGKAVYVPYRWVQSVGDVILLKYFPKRVTAKIEEEEQ